MPSPVAARSIGRIGGRQPRPAFSLAPWWPVFTFGYDEPMTRTVGRHGRCELVPDPAEALRRGRLLDAMLASTLVPVPRGVLRAPHATLNRLDDERQLQAARRLNAPS